MRTTINLQDSAFQAASDYAAARAMKLGDAVSELVALGLRRQQSAGMPIKKTAGIWIFDSATDATIPKLTAAQVKALIDES